MRIVVKVGSNVLTRPDGRADITRMSAIVDQIAALHAAGNQVVLVSSGAVACGRGLVVPSKRLDTVEQRQLYSALGQAKLINLYYSLFAEYGIAVGQVLTMKESFASRRSYLNQRQCMEVMLNNGVVPVVNENDTVSITELMFTDNDELSGLVATMMDAQMLVILSNIDGLYTGDPSEPGSVLIRRVNPGDDIAGHISQARSGFGRGGMTSKCATACRLAAEGVAVVIANGCRDGVLCQVVNDPEAVPCTLFVPVDRAASPVKKWIAHSVGFAKGTVTVDDRAADLLRHSTRGVSLLPVGITAIAGDWDEGDIITIADSEGTPIGVGRAAYASPSARQLAGQRGAKALVHCDYLFIN